MRTVILSQESSTKSSSTATAMDGDEKSESNQNSCYFPGCRKDANCNCEICIASINATLDLLPQSVQGSSLTMLPPSKPIPRSPVSFNPDILSTPRTRTRLAPVPASPPLKSTARMTTREKTKEKKIDLGFCLIWMKLVLGLCLIFVAEFGFSWVVSAYLKPRLSPDLVRLAGEKSWVLPNLDERMVLLGKEIQSLVNGKVSNCSSIDSMWNIDQDGLLLISRCTLYNSVTEEVSIWGWPLQTAGLLTNEFSSRFFTILSGRVTEWSNGKIIYLVRKANSSWEQGKWSASTVQLDPNTWILEYKLSTLMQNVRLISAAMEYLKFRMTAELKKLKLEFCLSSAFGSQTINLPEHRFSTPT